jgi:hypothetical protein
MPESKAIDSWALLAWLFGQRAAPHVEVLLERAASGKLDLLMSWISAGEVYYIVARRNGRENAEEFLRRPFSAHRLGSSRCGGCNRGSRTEKQAKAPAPTPSPQRWPVAKEPHWSRVTQRLQLGWTCSPSIGSEDKKRAWMLETFLGFFGPFASNRWNKKIEPRG